MSRPLPFFFMLLAVSALVTMGQPERSPNAQSTANGAAPPMRSGTAALDASRFSNTSPNILGPLQFPSRWDWREHSGVSSVKNQGGFSACWAHAAIGDIESKVMINEAYEPDYSEVNIISCNQHDIGVTTGGSLQIAANYLSQLGSVYESCDPYPGDLPARTCINDSCPFQKTITEWRIIPNDMTSLKNAIYQYGPIQTHLCTYGLNYDFFAYYKTNDSCLFNISPPGDQNHHVLVVGWDDNLTCVGEPGGWIFKNTYGTGWGFDGYGFMKYGHGRLCEVASVISGYKDYDPEEIIHAYDERGWMEACGWGDGDDWGMMELTPSGDGWLVAVNFWAVAAPTEVDIYVYDYFDGYNLSSMLAGPVLRAVDNMGYYTEVLPMPVRLVPGNPVYIAVRFNTFGYGYPIPFDDNFEEMEVGKSFVSDGGSGWEALDSLGLGWGDIAIRGRAMPYIDRGDPAFFQAFQDTARDVHPGETVAFELMPCNFGSIASAVCPFADSFCVDAGDSLGWDISGYPPPLRSAIKLYTGSYTILNLLITVPCDAEIGQANKVITAMNYWRGSCMSYPDACEDPNWYGGLPYYSSDTIRLNVVENQDKLSIQHEPLSYVNEGQRPVSVPFSLCNGDPCTDPADINYHVTSRGHIGDPIDRTGTETDISYDECKELYAVLDASESVIGDRDTLTIVAWHAATASEYDTSELYVEVREYTDVPDEPLLPAAFRLHQNHPNPFNPHTEINYELPQDCRVTLEIFDIAGRKVAVLVDGHQEAGYKKVRWDGKGMKGATLPSGIYFYRLRSGNHVDSRKMILIR